MIRSAREIRFAVATALLVAASPALPQPARVPASQLGPPSEPFAAHPYKSALGAVANYQSCGVHVRRAALLDITAALRSAEGAAIAKGLGPTLARLRQEYEALMAVSDMAACAGGPRRALAGARGAVGAFRAWVTAQPAR